MKKMIISAVLFFVIITGVSQNKKATQSILTVQPTKQFDNFEFNKKLHNEIDAKIIVMYRLDDFNADLISINTTYFSKPISKFAFENENYKKMRFYKNAIPQPVDFINFQRNINK